MYLFIKDLQNNILINFNKNILIFINLNKIC